MAQDEVHAGRMVRDVEPVPPLLSPSPYIGNGRSSIALVMNSGTSFSGCWYGPYVFEPRVMTASRPWVMT